MAARKSPTKKGEAPTRQTMDAIIAQVCREQNDPYVMIRGSDMKPEITRISSGLLTLDIALGGGFATNAWHEVVGNQSSGKTALVHEILAHNQAVDPDFEALWVASEDYVAEYADSIGVDRSRVTLLETNEMELAYGTVIKVLENQAADMIVIDSYPALVPTGEDEAAMEDWQVGLGARLTGKFGRKAGKAGKRSIHVDSDERDCTVFIINQWRDKIGGFSPHGTPQTTPGGRDKDYRCFTRIDVRRGDWLSSKNKLVGQSIGFKTIKNKSYKPQQTAEVDFYFDDSPLDGMRKGAFDRMGQVITAAVEAGIITRKGGWHYYDDVQLGNGPDNAKAYLLGNADVYTRIHDATFRFFIPEQEPPAVVMPEPFDDAAIEEAASAPEPAPKKKLVKKAAPKR